METNLALGCSQFTEEDLTNELEHKIDNDECLNVHHLK